MSRERATRKLIETWFDAALHAVEPARCVRESVLDLDLKVHGRLHVLAIGKAATAMYRGAHDALGDRIDRGLIVTKAGSPEQTFAHMETVLAGHPTPDEESLRAGELAQQLVADLGKDDLVIALISGGGSALLERPIEPITLDEFQQTTRLLMAAGADIHQLNAVRTKISAVKGGGLRRMIGEARSVTLMISDVIGSDPTVIASGPTIVADQTSLNAKDVLERFDLTDRVPESVQRVIASEGDITPFDTHDDVVRIIADNATAMDAFADAAREDGFSVSHAWDAFEGSIDDLAARMIESTVDTSSDVLVGGGEATVVVRGEGRGGRNSAAMAELLRTADSRVDGWMFASLATDGDDGNSEAAGAIVHTGLSLSREDWSAIDEDSDSAAVLDRQGALYKTGPTGTNVNDVYVAVRMRGGDA